jgi:VWFA-related protein
MPKPVKIVSSLFLLALLAGLHSAQHIVGSNKQVIQLNTDLVVVDAQVLSKKKNLPADKLKQDDFIISEDGIIQEITHFGHDNLPISIILLVDVSLSVTPVREQISTCADQALKSLRAEDKVALMVFNSAAWLVQDFTTDKALVANRLHIREDGMWDLPPAPGWSAETPPDGTRIADSIHQASEYMRKATEPMGRRVIIVVTDNDARSRKSRYSDNEVTNELLESGAMVYGIKVNTPLLDRIAMNLDYADPAGLAVLFNRNKRNVTPYANRTGGLMLNEKSNLAESLSKVMDFLRRRYSFGYTSTNPLMDGKFRKIKVRVASDVEKRESGVVILTRQGYHARRRENLDKPMQEKPPAPKNN